MIKLGLIGKTNTGKTTFFNAATLLAAEVSTYPFTTKQPNVGVAHVQTICVCKELGVEDNPQNSLCIDGWRFLPIELIDLPGLIKDAWKGKGLGNQFLSVAAQADALLHVVDASGSIDAEGRITKPGVGDPIADVYDIEEELVMWLTKVIDKNLPKAAKMVEARKASAEKALTSILAGLKIEQHHVAHALKDSELEGKELKAWTEDDVKRFAWSLREVSKPTVIVANKMDLPYAEENYKSLVEEFKGMFVVPCSAEAELALKRAEQKGFVKYVPGEEVFRVVDAEKLTDQQKWALEYVEKRVMRKWVRTGVQFAMNIAVFKLLGMNVVYPVDDVTTFSDKKGNVLPDALLVKPGTTVKDLAEMIHSDLAKTMVHAIDARTGLRLPKDYELKDRDVIKIVAAAERR